MLADAIALLDDTVVCIVFIFVITVGNTVAADDARNDDDVTEFHDID